ASPGSLSVTQGAGGGSVITVTPQNGFSGAVNFSASGLPSGVSASFNPPSDPASSTVTFTAAANAVVGTFSVTITGASGILSSKTNISLTIVPAGNFGLSAAPSNVSIAQGSAGTSTFTVNPVNGFNSAVALSASDLPSGATASFNPANTATSSTMTINVGSAVATGTYQITVTGTSGSLVNSTAVSLTVTPGPNFSLA